MSQQVCTPISAFLILASSEIVLKTSLSFKLNTYFYVCILAFCASKHNSLVLKFFSDPPIIIKPSENETEQVYQSDVVCQAEGNPSPTYVWKNASGEVIADKSTFKAAKGGNFTCYATNNITTVFRSIFITITCKLDIRMV